MMTATSPSPTRAQPRQRVERLSLGQTLATVATYSAIIVVLLVVALSVQMAHGGDPALGPKVAARPQPQAARVESTSMTQDSSATATSPAPAPDPAPVVTSVS
jgi:hypothetical protein